MKRQTRPFAVEIKSSRRPAQKAAPVLTETPQVASAPPDLWSDSVSEVGRDRTPASLAAREEANRVFAKLTSPAPILPQRSDPLRAVTAAGPGEPFCSTADEPKAEPPSAGHRAGRRGSVLPDLRTQTSSENAARPQDADQRSAPRNRHRPQQKKTSVAQPGGLLQEPASSDHVSTPQIKPAVDAMSLSDHPENGSGPQPAAPAVSSTVRSAKPRRSVRALDQSWAYRAACRKAARRGKPLPSRAAQRRKPR
jgi:hypothetical protein